MHGLERGFMAAHCIVQRVEGKGDIINADQDCAIHAHTCTHARTHTHACMHVCTSHLS